MTYSKHEAGEYPNMIDNARWDAVSASAQSLVLQMLQRDPFDRPSAQKVRPSAAPTLRCAVRAASA